MAATEVPVDAATFRRAMGRFASGVTVVTARAPDGDVHGMTASAFLSVSLEPRLVVVSIARAAHQHAVVAAARRYGICILRAGQEHEAMRFAGRPAEGLAPPVFAEREGVPILAGGLAWLAARVVDAHPAGDHTLYVGEVLALEAPDDDAHALAYHAGAFHHLGRPLDRHRPADLDPWLGGLESRWG